jgi:glucose/mannose-6-phosphate isomerase
MIDISKIDKSNMRKTILDFPKQFRIGIEAAKNVYLKSLPFSKKPENIIVCGMGGSALPGDVLATLESLDVFVYRSYQLPPQAGKESLIICISYSGNTEETLSAFHTAFEKKLPLISITTGGKLFELSKKYGVPCAKLPWAPILPRIALGETFSALVKILQNHNILKENLIKELLELETSLKPEDLENQGKKLAKKIFKKIPIIYTSRRFRKIGWIWKNSLNEGAKILAITNHFPELNHNEIVGFWKINEKQIKNKKICVLVLRDKDESYPRVLTQMEITKDLLNKEGIEVEFVDMVGKTMLEKIFSTVILGFWTAYWLAIEYKIDPTPVKLIDEFKRRMAEIKN